MNTIKDQFFGFLENSKVQEQQALKMIEMFYNDGGYRLRGDDLELMRKIIGEKKKLIKAIESFNHGKFSLMLNEVVENRLAVEN